MAQTQISDVVVPAEFTAYQVEDGTVGRALLQSGVAVANGEISSQLQTGAEQLSSVLGRRRFNPTSNGEAV